MDELHTLFASSQQQRPQSNTQLPLSPAPALSQRSPSISGGPSQRFHGRAIPDSKYQYHLQIGRQTPDLGCDWEEAETFLASFQTERAWSIPFATIPRHTTAQNLDQNRSFLWSSIITVSDSRDEVVKEFTNLLVKNILIDDENSLDLLQGLLVYISW